MKVHGIMKIWSDIDGDFDSEILNPLYMDREEAKKVRETTKVGAGERLELVQFDVV